MNVARLRATNLKEIVAITFLVIVDKLPGYNGFVVDANSGKAIMDLPIKFPNDADVVAQEAARFRALSPQEQWSALSKGKRFGQSGWKKPFPA